MDEDRELPKKKVNSPVKTFKIPIGPSFAVGVIS
jgi:hypothetical protein